MELTVEETNYDRSKKIVLFLEDSDLIMCRMDSFSSALVRECEASNSIADKLLALEHIVRSIESERGKNRNSFNVVQQAIKDTATPSA